MELLKKIFIFLSMFIFMSCGEDSTVTQVIKVRTDSYISSSDLSDHSTLEYLKLSKSSSLEERIIFKLPTTNESEDDLTDRCFDNFEACMIFYMPLAIISAIITTCTNEIVQPSNLTSAILVFNTNDGSSVASGTLNLNLLATPWWHTVNWNRAYPFSNEGKWSNAGGDIDSSFTFSNNCEGLSDGSCDTSEIKFDVTDYFKELISNENSIHYGMMISANSDLNSTRIYSVQANSTYSPRVVATYTGSCTSMSAEMTKTYYLGHDLEIVTGQ